MFIHVRTNEIELTAVGIEEMDLLHRLAECGVHVQASDFSKGYCSSVVLALKLIPESRAIPTKKREEHPARVLLRVKAFWREILSR